MAEPASQLKSAVPVRLRLWIAGFVLMPYLSYGGLLLLAGLYGSALWRGGRQILRWTARQGFGWLAVGLIACSIFAIAPGESFLQLANFLPFFLLPGVILLEPALQTKPFVWLEKAARILLLSSLPITVLAHIQYYIKNFFFLSQSQQKALFPEWLHWQIYRGGGPGRADAVLANANGLCIYLLVIGSVGIGLLLCSLARQKPFSWLQWVECLALVLCGSGIYMTGSRNGFLVLLLLVGIMLWVGRRYRWLRWGGMGAIAALLFAGAALGIGRRAISLAVFQADPRYQLWPFALQLMMERPLLGWGLSGVRQQYVPNSIPGFEYLAHPHSVYLLLGAEAGIPVLIGFCWVIGRLYYQGVRTYLLGGLAVSERAILLGYLLAFLSSMLYSLFDVMLYDSRHNMYAWGSLSMIVLLTRYAERCQNLAEINKKND